MSAQQAQTKRVNLRLEPGMHALLVELARDRGATMSEVIRDSIRSEHKNDGRGRKHGKSQTFEELCAVVDECLEQAVLDLRALDLFHKVFTGIQQIVANNPVGKTRSVLWDYLVTTYAHYAAAAVRRMLDDKNLSLLVVLNHVQVNYELVTRAAWIQRRKANHDGYWGPDDDDAAHLGFDAVVGAGHDRLSRKAVTKDKSRLVKTGKCIKDFADSRVAHIGHSPRGAVSWPELSTLIDQYRDVASKYLLLLRDVTDDARFSNEDNWRRLFKTAWCG